MKIKRRSLYIYTQGREIVSLTFAVSDLHLIWGTLRLEETYTSMPHKADNYVVHDKLGLNEREREREKE